MIADVNFPYDPHSTPHDLKVGDDKRQVIVYRPTDHKLADALQNLLRQSVAVHWTLADCFNQAVDPVLPQLRFRLNDGVRKQHNVITSALDRDRSLLPRQIERR